MAEVKLVNTDKGLTLTDGKLEMSGDFSSMLSRLKPNNLNGEMLVKAAKIKNPDSGRQYFAIDATAGMGEDSLLLAAIGYNVTLFEKDPVIAALLRDSLKRASHNSDLSEIVSRMVLVEGDSIEAMSNLDFKPDLILLDPMFPTREKSGLIKKKFQLLQQLERPCDDEESLFSAAKNAHPSKIVVKRPGKGPNLAGVKPSYTINGNSIRYDVYVLS